MKKIELLQSLTLFWDLDEKELGRISKKMVSAHYNSGQVIVLEASEGDHCFFVTKGKTEVNF